MLGYTGYLAADTFPSFLVLVSFLGFIDFGKIPAREALILSTTGLETRVHARAVLKSLFNVGFSVGAGLATVLLSMDSQTARYAFILVNSASFLSCVVLGLRLPSPAKVAPKPRLRRMPALRNLPFVAVTTVTGVMTLHISVLLVVLPLWIVSRTSVSGAIIGALYVMNTLLTVIFQVRVTRNIESLADGSRAAMQAALLFAASCICIGLAGSNKVWLSAVVLFVGVVILTIGEMLQASSRWAISYALAPSHAQAEYLGAFNIGIAGQSFAGPFLCTSLIMILGVFGWIVLAFVFVAAGAVTRPLAAWSGRVLASSE